MNKDLRKILKFIFVIQEKDVEGCSRMRYNPYNPLTYVFVLVMSLVLLILYIIACIIEWFLELCKNNPFKWH